MLIAEHANAVAWRLLIDWPPLLGAAADPRTYAAFLRAGAPIAAGADRLHAIGGAPLRPPRAEIAGAAASLAAMLAALFPEAADPTLSFDALEAALGQRESAPARLIARARVNLPENYGRHDRPLFVSADADWFAARLAGTPGFSEAPTLDGRPAEVGPLAALRHPLVGEALAHWGQGLATRLLAAALDAPVVAARLRDACDLPVDAQRPRRRRGGDRARPPRLLGRGLRRPRAHAAQRRADRVELSSRRPVPRRARRRSRHRRPGCRRPPAGGELRSLRAVRIRNRTVAAHADRGYAACMSSRSPPR
jgi:hypothetical protein